MVDLKRFTGLDGAARHKFRHESDAQIVFHHGHHLIHGGRLQLWLKAQAPAGKQAVIKGKGFCIALQRDPRILHQLAHRAAGMAQMGIKRPCRQQIAVFRKHDRVQPRHFFLRGGYHRHLGTLFSQRIQCGGGGVISNANADARIQPPEFFQRGKQLLLQGDLRGRDHQLTALQAVHMGDLGFA